MHLTLPYDLINIELLVEPLFLFIEKLVDGFFFSSYIVEEEQICDDWLGNYVFPLIWLDLGWSLHDFVFIKQGSVN